jgi:hypothetical protein
VPPTRVVVSVDVVEKVIVTVELAYVDVDVPVIV